MNIAAHQPPPGLQVVLWEHVAPVFAKLAALEQKVEQLEAGQSEWVDTKEAQRITGIKSADTLKRLREQPGSLLVVKKEGKTGRMPMYLRKSLLLYNASKVLAPRRPAAKLF